MPTSVGDLLCPKCRENVRRWAKAQFAAGKAMLPTVVRLASISVPEIRDSALIPQVVGWGYSDVCELLFESGQ